MSDSNEDAAFIGGIALMLACIVGGLAWGYDSLVGKAVIETQTVAATATDARTTGGKFMHKYQVEILITRDANGQLHKIDCPLEFWIDAKENQHVTIKHWKGPIFDSYKLDR